MTTQFKVNPGLSIFRKSGGVAGTDEIQISHNGTFGLLESKNGNITLKTGSRTVALSSTAIIPDSGGVLSLGSLSNYFSNVYSSTLISAVDLALSATNGTSAPGHAITITAGSATNANNNGGNITLTPGAANGTGLTGKVIVVGTLTASELDTTSIQRGSAGTVSLFADAGANNITIGGSTSTLVVAGDLQINGTTTTINSTNLTVNDQNITVNRGGTTAGSVGAGINIEGDAASVVGYLRVSTTDNSKLEFKAPTGSILTLDTTADSTLAMSADLTVTAASTIDQNLSTGSDVSFLTVSSTGTGVNSFAGSVVVGAPTGGDQGVGTINATAIYIDGTAVAGGITTLDDLTDVTITSPSSGDVLHYSGSQWVNDALGSASGVQAWDADLDTIAGLAQGSDHFIISNGTNWTSATVSLSQLTSPVTDFSFDSNRLTDLATPTQAQDAATKAYVDAAVSGLNVHGAVIAATTGALVAAYVAGSTGADTGTGVGATLTNTDTQAALVIDGYAVSVNDRVLVKDQADAKQNGIYIVTDIGSVSTDWVLTRADDYDNHAIATEVASGDFTFVQHGTIYATTGFIQTGTNPIVIGTSNISFTQFSAAGVYTAGTGLTLTGTQFSITNIGTAGTYFQVTTNAQGQVTSGSNPTTLSGFGITDAQPLDSNLTTLAGLAQGTGNIIVSDGTNWTVESDDTARHSLGLGSADTATFTGVNIGVAGATSNTYIMNNSTTDETVTELFLDGTSTQLLIADGKTWAFEVVVAARRTDSGTEAARFKIDGALARFGSTSTTTLIGDNETSESSTNAAWSVDVSADTTTGALKVAVTGEAAKDVKWVAFVRIVEASL